MKIPIPPDVVRLPRKSTGSGSGVQGAAWSQRPDVRAELPVRGDLVSRAKPPQKVAASADNEEQRAVPMDLSLDREFPCRKRGTSFDVVQHDGPQAQRERRKCAARRSLEGRCGRAPTSGPPRPVPHQDASRTFANDCVQDGFERALERKRRAWSLASRPRRRGLRPRVHRVTPEGLANSSSLLARWVRIELAIVESISHETSRLKKRHDQRKIQYE